ncbi:MAG: Zn-dependent hydrolase, glyoxylase [Thermoleophilia bacterium]|nr:Zn-dependent hydrolase, glyoxylase [Thermoleophilia bacterium]
MQIRCLRTGVVRERVGTRGVRRYLAAPWRDDALPVNAFLVEHPAGLCLFDTGQSARAAQPGYFPHWHPFFRLARFELAEENEAAAQLESSGLRPRDVRWVVLSHLHTDHVAGLEPFRDAEVVLSRVEWDRARGIGGKLRGYLPQFWPSGLEPTLLDLDSEGFGPFPASHDLAGDGALIVVATPGHTPGHVSLVVRRPGESIVLGGDLADNRHDLERDDPAVARYCSEQGLAYAGAHDWDALSLVTASQTA